jgi:hypothetical protein
MNVYIFKKLVHAAVDNSDVTLEEIYLCNQEKSRDVHSLRASRLRAEILSIMATSEEILGGNLYVYVEHAQKVLLFAGLIYNDRFKKQAQRIYEGRENSVPALALWFEKAKNKIGGAAYSITDYVYDNWQSISNGIKASAGRGHTLSIHVAAPAYGATANRNPTVLVTKHIDARAGTHIESGVLRIARMPNGKYRIEFKFDKGYKTPYYIDILSGGHHIILDKKEPVPTGSEELTITHRKEITLAELDIKAIKATRQIT